MEHHAAAYQQIIDVNNVNQGTEFISEQLVQEIVVQNDNNQGSALNCELPSGIGIMLPNDCVSESIHDQCNSNIMVSCNTDSIVQEKQSENISLKQDSKKDGSISQMNNVEENVASYDESQKEEKMEEVISHNQTTYCPENVEVSDSVSIMTKTETDSGENVSEALKETNESVPLMNVNDSVTALSNNQSPDNHNVLNNGQSIINDLSDVKDENLKEPDQSLETVFTNEKVTECFVSSIQTENIGSMEDGTVSIVSEVVTENVVVSIEQEIQAENHSENVKDEKDIDLKSKEINMEVSSEIAEKNEYPVLVTESVKETNIITNSDDVAVLTEFSSVEYNIQIDSSKEEEGNPKSEVTEESNSKSEVTEESSSKSTVTEENNPKSEVNEQNFQELAEAANEKSEIIKTEQISLDNKASIEPNNLDTKNNDVSMYEELVNNDDDEDEDELDLHLSAQSTDNHRKVIQDIFDDWQDENCEEDNNQSSNNAYKDNHDSVEMELQNLLNDGTQQEEIVSSTNAEHSFNTNEKIVVEQIGVGSTTPEKPKVLKSEKVSPLNKSGLDPKTSTPSTKSPKSHSNSFSTKDESLGRSAKAPNQEQSSDPKQKHQTPRPGVKVPGLHLTSQIASTAEVTEALKERLREKQKDLVVPNTADIVFVKKITQRLSSQLSAAASVVPPLIPLQTSQQLADSSEKDKDKPVTGEEESSRTAADKELLAILEGDVDPDWSNLKSVTEESNKISNSTESHSTGSTKLDPAIERELALKQLLELPNIPAKKNSPAVSKKTTKKSGRTSKASNDSSESKSAEEAKAEVISLDSTEEESPKKDKAPKALKENNSQNTRSSSMAMAAAIVELSVEESRSGRKRKLTEKAREHELTVKRQKVYKVKTVAEKKYSQESGTDSANEKSDVASPAVTEPADEPKADAEPSSTPSAPSTPSTPSTLKASEAKPDAKQTKPEIKQTKAETKQAKAETKQTKAEAKASPAKAETKQTKAEAKATPAKAETKQPETKLAAGVKGKMTPVKRPKIGLLKKDAPISKRKLAVKNLLRQKMTGKKAVAAAAAKAKIQAASTPKTDSPTKGAPEKSTAGGTPVTKTKKINSEIDKLLQDEGVVNLLYDVEQPDSRKRLVPITKSQKKVMDVEKAERELKLRTKLVRNAVLRLRNSNSSTVKISPRSRRNISVTEQPAPQSEKKPSESMKSPKSPAVASVPSDFIIPAKIRNAADASRIIRRHSSSSFSSASASPRVSIDMPPELLKIDEPETQSKSKRKLSHDALDKLDAKKNKKKAAPKAEAEEKDANEKSPAKKEPVKKITTRSNVAGAPTAKIVAKNKKVPKSKASSESSTSDVRSSKGQDELSACLAEAASALLSSVSTGSSRSSSASVGRKKASTNLLKADDEKVDGKKLFSNKEINVRHHGHLVQLILTPSAPISGIRNAITIQFMNEMREALSILKNDDDCRVVLFTSTGTSFCEGLELSSLLHSNKEERKSRAEEMSTTVKEFIRALAAFNKPIVAGVQGAAIGLGVTMLPLFDLVIASDKATFSTPYGKLAQIAEGAAVLTLSHSLGSAVTNELLLGGRVLTASEALRAGLVTRVLWPDRFQGELLPSLKAMSEQSSQSMEATKALLRYSLRKKIEEALESESFLLIEHWCSLECQEAIKAYIEEKGQ